MPLGSGASSLAWVLSAGLPRRWAVDRCQADGERDQRARGAKEDRHHRDEQPAEQRLPGGVPQPREVQERSEESEQDDYGRPHSTRVQERTAAGNRSKRKLPAESVVGDEAAVRPGAPAAYGQTSAG
jgi:hypothetical protein